MSADKLDDLIIQAFEDRDFKAPPLVDHPSGKKVCPGHPKICLHAGWCAIVERLCNSCPYFDNCFGIQGD